MKGVADLFNSKLTITYIANSGVAVTGRKKQILVDGLHKSEAGFYFSTDPQTAEDIILSKEPYNLMDILLVTHDHSDHFNATYCVEALKKNRHLQLVGPQSVADKVKSCPEYDDELASQIKSIEASPVKPIVLSLKDIDIEIFCITHDGASADTTVNNAYLVRMDRHDMLFLGDAKADDAVFESAGVYGKKVEVLFVPFTFIGLSSGREIIKKIAPKKLVVVHLPDESKDANKLTEKTKIAHTKYFAEFPPTTMFDTIGQSFKI